MSNGGTRKTTSADFPARDRDVRTDKHRTPVGGVRIVTEVHDENSGAIDDPARRAAFREQRPMPDRVAVLEVRADQLLEAQGDTNDTLIVVHRDLGDLKVAVATVSTRLETIINLQERAEALRNAEISAEQARANAIILADEKRRAGRAKFWLALAKVMVTAITAVGVALAAYAAAKSNNPHPPAAAVDK